MRSRIVETSDLPISSLDMTGFVVARTKPDWLIPSLVESFEKLGFFRPILVQQNSLKIIDGRSRVAAAKKAGMLSVPAHILDVEDQEAVRIALEHDAIASMAATDPRALAELGEFIGGFGEFGGLISSILGAAAESPSLPSEFFSTAEERNSSELVYFEAVGADSFFHLPFSRNGYDRLISRIGGTGGYGRASVAKALAKELGFHAS